MDAKGFLKPEWKKLVIPLILIFLFLITLYAFVSLASAVEPYYCNASIITRNVIDYTRRFALLNETLQKTGNLSEAASIRNEIGSLKQLVNENMQNAEIVGKRMNDVLDSSLFQPPMAYFYTFTILIDPFFPMPCEFTFWSSESCRFYMSKKTYDCIAENLDLGAFLLFSDTPRAYVGLDLPIIFLNIAILFLVGFLLSCLIVFVLSWFAAKYRIRKEWARLAKRWSG